VWAVEDLVVLSLNPWLKERTLLSEFSFGLLPGSRRL
jgi:hypothetical protein